MLHVKLTGREIRTVETLSIIEAVLEGGTSATNNRRRQGDKRGEMELIVGTSFCIKTMKLVAVQSPAVKLLKSSKKEKLTSDFF